MDRVLPVPRRALALVLRQPGQAVLSLLRLRRARQRGEVPDGVRAAGVPRRGGGAGAVGRADRAARRRSRRASARGQDRPLRPARRLGQLVPAAAAEEPRGAGLLQEARTGRGHHRALPPGLGAGRLRRRDQGAGHRRQAPAAAQRSRHGRQQRARQQVRPLPRTADVPDPRPPRPGDRLRRKNP